jgi:hypothetical protein
MRYHTMTAAIVALALGAGANASVGVPYFDAQGDQVRPFEPEGFAHDLYMIDAFFNPRTNEFVVEVVFHNEISNPNSFEGAAGIVTDDADVVVFLGFDLDNDPTTGDRPLQNEFEFFAKLGLGMDLQMALTPFGDEAALGAIMFGEEFDVPVEFFETHFVARMDLSLRDVAFVPGEYGFAAIVGSLDQPTDASDSIGYTRIVPAPGAGALLALSGLAGVSRRRR